MTGDAAVELVVLAVIVCLLGVIGLGLDVLLLGGHAQNPLANATLGGEPRVDAPDPEAEHGATACLRAFGPEYAYDRYVMLERPTVVCEGPGDAVGVTPMPDAMQRAVGGGAR